MPTKSSWNSCGCRSSMARERLTALTPTPTRTQRMGLCMTGTMKRRPGSPKYEYFFTSKLLFSRIMLWQYFASVYDPVFTAVLQMYSIQYCIYIYEPYFVNSFFDFVMYSSILYCGNQSSIVTVILSGTGYLNHTNKPSH